MAGVENKDYKRKTVSAKTKTKPKLIKVRKAKSAADVRAGAVAWALDVAADNRFHYGCHDAHHNGCFFCNHQIGKRGNNLRMYCYCCNPFIGAAYAHGGGDLLALKVCGHVAWDFATGYGYDKLAKRGERFKRLHPKSLNDLIPGDVGCIQYGSGGHVYMYVGKWGGKHHIVEASGGDDNKVGSRRWNNSVHTEVKTSLGGYRWYRYTGAGVKKWGWMCRLSSTGTASGTAVSASDLGGETGTTSSGGVVSDDGSGIILEKEIAKLWSAENFEQLQINQNEEDESITAATNQFKSILIGAQGFEYHNPNSGAVPETLVKTAINGLDFKTSFDKNKPKRLKNVTETELMSYPNFVEAPTIVLDFNGIKIGGYGNRGDQYPNYIDSMSVKKINGRINQYTLNLSYQIRPNEDPNFLDKLISRTGYRNPLKILYGDSYYPTGYFREEEAVILDVKQSEDPASCKINYTISAISSIGVSLTSNKTYSSQTTKPSSAIYNLLYNSGETSQSLMNSFPGMQNKQLVASSGLIPTTDAVVNIGGLTNASPLSYLTHAVSCMTNAAGETSSYFLSYMDDSAMNGSYFKISEVKKLSNSDSFSTNETVYSIDVGYPTNNFVTNFQVNNNEYWGMAYKFAGDIPYYEYTMDAYGNVVSNKVNVATKNSKFNDSSLIDENWWKQVTEFPITAKLTLKGLVSPAMLMSYINVNVLFYSQRDIASGLYVVTEENDTISGNGYTTELTLLKVAED